MQEIDRAFKTVLTLKPDCLLDLLFGSQRQTYFKEIADPQINIPELRADKMLLVEDHGELFYLLCEAMIQPDINALSTFALKALGHQYMLNKPTLAVIIYLEKGNYATFPDNFETRLGALSNRFVLSKILLWEHEARIVSGELKEWAPFLSLFYAQPDPVVMDVQKGLLSQISDPKLQADLMATAMVLDGRAFGTELVMAKFANEVNMLKDTSIVQGWLAESRQEGQQIGQQIGQREGKLAVMQSLLAKKFDSLPPTLFLQMQRLSNEQLDRLILAFLDINSQEELHAWLANGIADSAKN